MGKAQAIYLQGSLRCRLRIAVAIKTTAILPLFLPLILRRRHSARSEITTTRFSNIVSVVSFWRPSHIRSVHVIVSGVTLF